MNNASSTSAGRVSKAPFIYVVDDTPELTELYAAVLKAAGYCVRTFNDRAEALTALKADRAKPDLLITDYLGLSIPVDRFISRCLVVNPTLRVLMASGFNQTEARVFSVHPDRFIQKPFTLDELRQEVRAALIV